MKACVESECLLTQWLKSSYIVQPLNYLYSVLDQNLDWSLFKILTSSDVFKLTGCSLSMQAFIHGGEYHKSVGNFW